MVCLFLILLIIFNIYFSGISLPLHAVNSIPKLLDDCTCKNVFDIFRF